MSRLDLQETVAQGTPTLCDFLAHRTGLSRSRLKKAMTCGAAWVARGKARARRIRRATFALKPGDRVALHYDDDVLDVVPPQATLLEDRIGYSVWVKPAGLLTQGTQYGDHASLLRQAEQHFRNRPAHAVHRLDREAQGLVLVGHSPRATAELSRLFRDRLVTKRYEVEVLGIFDDTLHGVIDAPLDGRPSVTRCCLLFHDPGRNLSRLAITLETGRRHQIRRHLERIGHPVLGDPLYGDGNKNTEGLRLMAVELSFVCPLRRQPVTFRLPRVD